MEKELTYYEILNIGLVDETAKRQARDIEKAIGNDMNSINKVTEKLTEKELLQRRVKTLIVRDVEKSWA